MNYLFIYTCLAGRLVRFADVLYFVSTLISVATMYTVLESSRRAGVGYPSVIIGYK